MVEAYRGQQQEKLRENYHQQTEWIRDNCAQQMERVRENYNSQIQNLKDIRLAGGAHLHAVRDQYYEQVLHNCLAPVRLFGAIVTNVLTCVPIYRCTGYETIQRTS